MRRRKLVSQINVVPFIDVMLVLLVVFMIATPTLRTGEINLPSVGQPLTPTQANPIEINIRADGAITLREADTEKLTRTNAVNRVVQLQTRGERPVLIAADKTVRYDDVVTLLGALHAAGVKRVGLAAREGN
jgi:biopolymer transport protein TolR